jgi:hypothetical protein
MRALMSFASDSLDDDRIVFTISADWKFFIHFVFSGQVGEKAKVRR